MTSTHKVISLFIILLTLVLFFTPSAFAERAKPSELGSIRDPEDRAKDNPLPEAAPNVLEVADEELAELPETMRWELALATKAYNLEKNLRTTSDLITVLSKSVEALCFQELYKKLSYYPPPHDPGCLKVLPILTEIDPENPLVVCANAGIETEGCKNSYANQKTEASVPPQILSAYAKKSKESVSQIQFENDLSARLEVEKTKIRISKLEKAAKDVESKISRNAKKDKKIDEDLNQKREQIYTELLNTSCNGYRVITFPEQVTEIVKKNKKTADATSNSRTNRGASLEEMLQAGPFSEKIVNQKKETVYARFRLMSSRCISNLNDLTSKVPHLVAIPCFREGAASPHCVAARRSKGTTGGSPGVPSYTNSANDGLERF